VKSEPSPQMKKQDGGRSKSRQAMGSPRVEQPPSQPVRPAKQPLAGRWWGRILINAFILWHLFALTIWLLPESALRQSWIGLVSPYMTWTGFMQSWSLFSPNPAPMEVYVEARITYADGRARSWVYPRMVNMGYLERYRRERFRKLIEMAHPDENRVVWPSLARYAARRNNLNPGNPPVSVALVRHFRAIPPPGLLFAPFKTYLFFQMPVRSGDLR
jgi:hypothetical protein